MDRAVAEPASYLTIGRPAEAEIEVSRSRFRCRLERVGEEAAARVVVEEERRRHHDARHHCTAYRIGPDGALARSNDDGEPSGTAGAPMLEALRGAGVSDVVAVVTRWFGGVLLGTGGLTRAYGDAVRAALVEAGTRVRELRIELLVTLDHDIAARVEHGLRARGETVSDVRYGTGVELLVAVVPSRVRGVEAAVAELSGGAAGARATGRHWYDGGTAPARPASPPARPSPPRGRR